MTGGPKQIRKKLDRNKLSLGLFGVNCSGGLAVTTSYVQTTLRLEPKTKDLLDALTRLLGRPQRQVTGEALALYAQRLKLSDRQLLHGLLSRKD